MFLKAGMVQEACWLCKGRFLIAKLNYLYIYPSLLPFRLQSSFSDNHQSLSDQNQGYHIGWVPFILNAAGYVLFNARRELPENMLVYWLNV
jgi:hypothetical protein